jgi:hypothetical protein
MKKGKLSIQEHREIGTDLKIINERLLSILVIFANKVGRTKEPYLSLAKAEKFILVGRSQAEELLYRDHQSEDGGLMKAYFGQTTPELHSGELKGENVKQFEQPEKK